jgi:internalin A
MNLFCKIFQIFYFCFFCFFAAFVSYGQEAHSKFLKACHSRAPSSQHTIEVLKTEFQANTCEELLNSLLKRTYLVLRFKNLTDLSIMSEFTHFKRVNVGGNKISSIEFVKNMKNLKELCLGGILGYNNVKDLSPLAGLTQLEELVFNANEVEDLTPIQNLTNLTHLNGGRNKIHKLEPLAKLTNLHTLYLWGNKISDISALRSLRGLSKLVLNHNHIKDISSLRNLTHLKYLWIRDNHILDFRPLESLKHLETLLGDENPGWSDFLRNKNLKDQSKTSTSS